MSAEDEKHPRPGTGNSGSDTPSLPPPSSGFFARFKSKSSPPKTIDDEDEKHKEAPTTVNAKPAEEKVAPASFFSLFRCVILGFVLLLTQHLSAFPPQVFYHHCDNPPCPRSCRSGGSWCSAGTLKRCILSAVSQTLFSPS